MNIKQYQINLKTPHKFEKKVLASYDNAYLTFFSSSLLSISFDLMCISLNLSSLAMRGGRDGFTLVYKGLHLFADFVEWRSLDCSSSFAFATSSSITLAVFLNLTLDMTFSLSLIRDLINWQNAKFSFFSPLGHKFYIISESPYSWLWILPSYFFTNKSVWRWGIELTLPSSPHPPCDFLFCCTQKIKLSWHRRSLG